MPKKTKGNFLDRMLFVSLVDFDEEKAMPTPDLAKSWDVSADGKVWTFQLRKDVKWTNGRIVTARDVEYSIKRILDPAVASPLGNKLYMVKGAEAVNTGKSKDMGSVGIKVVDDWTIQFTLNNPLAFFAAQVRVVGYPVPKETVEKYGNKWYEPANIVSNGPYILKEWKPMDRLVFAKNPDYYDAKNVQIDNVTVFIVEDDSTAMSMYEAGQLDTAIAESRKLVDANPKDTSVRVQYGELLGKKKDWTGAIAQYAELIKSEDLSTKCYGYYLTGGAQESIGLWEVVHGRTAKGGKSHHDRTP
jgi:oligopeptide transport system substrate-binding protein